MSSLPKLLLLAAGLVIGRSIRTGDQRRNTAPSLADIMANREHGAPQRKPRRKPPEAGIAVPAIPPKGPLPKQGGAEAPLDFSD